MSKGVAQFGLGLGLFGLGTMASAGLHILTGGRSIDFSRRRVMAPLVKLALGAYGVRIEMDASVRQGSPTFYLFNHHSNLDIFVIAAMDLPQLRTFFSTETPKHAPMMLAARSMGAFLIAPQHQHEARVRCFQRAEAELKRTGASIIASPEGRRFIEGGVTRFNKGVFHLALRLGYPIVPLLFEIPSEANAASTYYFKPSTVRVRALEPIETQGLSETAIDEVRERARRIYSEAIAKSGIQKRNSTSTTVAEKARKSTRRRFMTAK